MFKSKLKEIKYDEKTLAEFRKTAGKPVWDAWVSKDNPPVRACVEAKLAAPEYKVEIQIIALI